MSKKTLAVLLKKDITNVGKVGDIKNVALGFARNYLLPRKEAVIATPAVIANYKAKLAQEKQAKARQLAGAQALAEKIKGLIVVLRVKAGEKGKLFGSVTREDIALALKDQHSLEINPKTIILPQPLKTLGKHLIPVALLPGSKTEFTVQTVSTKN